MKKAIFIVAVILLCVQAAFAAKIRNQLNQRLIINLPGGKTISLLAGGDGGNQRG